MRRTAATGLIALLILKFIVFARGGAGNQANFKDEVSIKNSHEFIIE